MFGGKNWDWTGTPIEKLWAWHNARRPDNAIEMAGVDAGIILKDVLREDRRDFATEQARRRGLLMRKYKWVKPENGIQPCQN